MTGLGLLLVLASLVVAGSTWASYRKFPEPATPAPPKKQVVKAGEYGPVELPELKRSLGWDGTMSEAAFTAEGGFRL